LEKDARRAGPPERLLMAYRCIKRKPNKNKQKNKTKRRVEPGMRTHPRTRVVGAS